MKSTRVELNSMPVNKKTWFVSNIHDILIPTFPITANNMSENNQLFWGFLQTQIDGIYHIVENRRNSLDWKMKVY